LFAFAAELSERQTSNLKPQTSNMHEQACLFYSGASGIVVPHKQKDYPAEFQGASRLTYYASMFNSIEINSSFYKLPKAATVKKWNDSVPGNFRFTFKLLKTLTHNKGLQFNSEDTAKLLEAISPIENKKACLLVQLPPSIKREREEELAALLEDLSGEAKRWKIAVEFRDNSWYHRPVYRMLQQYGATMVEQDLPASATPHAEVSGQFSYYRFHGPEGGYRGSYDDSVLEAYAKRIQTEMKNGKEVYAYFNNTMGNALGNLIRLNEIVFQSKNSKVKSEKMNGEWCRRFGR
jgi:uncharacterized protein YecE (DUF72 family)